LRVWIDFSSVIGDDYALSGGNSSKSPEIQTFIYIFQEAKL